MTVMPSAAPSTAFVFAAGFGTRMRPLTDTTPKPLLPVRGKPLIDWVVDHLKAAGVRTIVINGHHLHEQVDAYVRGRRDITLHYSHEPHLLDQGGGIKNAMGKFPDLFADPFFVINGDSLWLNDDRSDITALDALTALWNPAIMDVAMLLSPRLPTSTQGDYFRDENSGRLRYRHADEIAPYQFMGAQILAPDIFSPCRDTVFRLKPLYDTAEKRGRLYGLVHQGRWFHVDRPEELALTEQTLNNILPAAGAAPTP